MPDRDSGLLPAKTNRNCRYKQAVENSADEFLQIKILKAYIEAFMLTRIFYFILSFVHLKA